MSFGPPRVRMRQPYFPPPPPMTAGAADTASADAVTSAAEAAKAIDAISAALAITSKSASIALDNAIATASGIPLPPSHMVQQETIDALTQDYLREIKVRIKKRWLPPRGTEQIRVIAQFRLHRPGDVSRLAIHLSCGNMFIDQTCLRAVESSVYLPRIPDALPDFMDLQFVFEYGFGDEMADDTQQKTRQVMPPRRGRTEHIPSLQLPGNE